MTTSELPPLSSDLRDLLDLATSGPGPSPAAYARLKTRLDHSIASGGGGGGGGAALAHGKALLVAGVTAVVAATIWIAMPRTAQDEAPRAPIAASIAPAPPPAAAIVTPPPPAPADEPPSRASAAGSPPRKQRAKPAPEQIQPAIIQAAPPAAPRDDTLAHEREVIEQARRALATRTAGRAIALLDAHKAEFGDGQLAEEREALMVQALAVVGNPLAASARARAFRTTYPHSIFLDVVDAAAPPSATLETKESP